jgi:hypothetical protein
MPDRPKAFVAICYDENDRQINGIIMGIIATHFTIIPADLLSSKPPQKKVPGLIKDCDIFIAILTKRIIAGKKDWKTSEWVQNEIGMAVACRKPILLFREKGVEISGGIAKSVTTIADFVRTNISKRITEFNESLVLEACRLRQDKITKIDGWDDTKRAIAEIFETAEKYVHGVVEDFSSLESFESSLTQLNKEVEVSIICSPSGRDIQKMETFLSQLNFKKKNIRFADPTKIGRIRILFNENAGLLVIHGSRNQYFGIKISPIDELEAQFKLLLKESSPDKMTAKIEGRFCQSTRQDLSDLLTWAISAVNNFDERERFVYILGSQFTLFAQYENLKKAITDVASKDNCSVRFVLTNQSVDRGTHEHSLYEIITDTLETYQGFSIRLLKEDYPLGRRRMVITNKLAIDILDFHSESYYYSTIEDREHIDMLKRDFEELPVQKKRNFTTSR